MLPSSQRLTTQTYTPIALRGMPFHTKSILFKLSKPQQGQIKCAVTVSKKIAKTSVARNQLRRRIYSVLSSLLPSITPGVQMVVIAKQGILNLSFKELSAQIKEGLVISGVIPKNQ